jgi:hypothetical protein
MRTSTTPEATTTETAACRHHWVLGQPLNGMISASCKVCGAGRSYPAVLDDLDPRPDNDDKTSHQSAATAG